MEHQDGSVSAVENALTPSSLESVVESEAPRSRPEKKVGVGFQLAVASAFLGTNMALVPLVSITVALKVNEIAPDSRATSLSLVLGVGSVIALIAQNIFGALSDRTTSRFGMRRPWILAGMITTVASLFFLGSANSLPALILGWALTQLCFNILLGGLNPVVPDQVPSAQLGKVSGLMGVVQALSSIGGVIIAQIFLPNLMLAIIVPGAFTAVGVLVLLLVLRDRVLSPNLRQPFRLSLFVKAFWTSPRKHPDFALAWVSRFLVYFGNFTLINYQTFFLMDRFGYTPATVGSAILVVTLIGTVCTIASAAIVGVVSDRLQRRKVFVLVSASVLAVAHVVAALAPTFTVFVIASALAAIAMGVYLAVDSALIAEVLPSRGAVGKDMGVLHLANVLPQTLVPIVAPLFLIIGGGTSNYAALFIGGSVVGFAGAIVNQFIRSVK